MGLARVTWGAVGLLFLGAVLSGCGPDLHSVDDGVYGALVPTTQQWADDASKDIPGGFAALSADGVKAVVMRVAGNTVTFELDGRIAANRVVEDRRKVEDSEGSGLAKARAQVLILGDEPLELGSLKISQPVIWYAGGYSSAALVSIKPWDANERGPASQCGAADKQCLELPVRRGRGREPGRYLSEHERPGSRRESGCGDPDDGYGDRLHARHRTGDSPKSRGRVPHTCLCPWRVGCLVGTGRGWSRLQRPCARGYQLRAAHRQCPQPDGDGAASAPCASAVGATVPAGNGASRGLAACGSWTRRVSRADRCERSPAMMPDGGQRRTPDSRKRDQVQHRDRNDR